MSYSDIMAKYFKAGDEHKSHRKTNANIVQVSNCTLIVQVYMPTTDSDDEEIEKMYEKIEK